MKKHIAALILTPLSFTAWAAPYDTLSSALNEQTLIRDLRAECHIEASVPDENIKAVFLKSTENHHILSAAADALKYGRHSQYQRSLKGIHCPAALKKKEKPG